MCLSSPGTVLGACPQVFAEAVPATSPILHFPHPLLPPTFPSSFLLLCLSGSYLTFQPPTLWASRLHWEAGLCNLTGCYITSMITARPVSLQVWPVLRHKVCLFLLESPAVGAVNYMFGNLLMACIALGTNQLPPVS